MMFPEAIEHMRAKGRVNVSILHRMDFKSGTSRAWHALGPLVTGDGQAWTGIGSVVSIEGGGQQAGVVAPNLILTLAGNSDLISDDLTRMALNSETEVYGRRYGLALQFFDDDWQPTGAYRYIYSGIMDRMEFRRTALTREIRLNIESPFVRRRTKRARFFTHKDQQREWPNDRGLEFISTLASKTVTWPKYSSTT